MSREQLHPYASWTVPASLCPDGPQIAELRMSTHGNIVSVIIKIGKDEQMLCLRYGDFERLAAGIAAWTRGS